MQCKTRNNNIGNVFNTVVKLFKLASPSCHTNSKESFSNNSIRRSGCIKFLFLWRKCWRKFISFINEFLRGYTPSPYKTRPTVVFSIISVGFDSMFPSSASWDNEKFLRTLESCILTGNPVETLRNIRFEPTTTMSVNGVPLLPGIVIKLSFIFLCLNENMGSIYGTDGLWNFTITITFK